MRSALHFFAVTCIVTATGLFLTGCGEKEAALRVVNQNDNYIYRVFIADDYYDVTIPKGQSKTFAVPYPGANIYSVQVSILPLIYLGKDVKWESGKTARVTLTADMQLK